MATIQRPVKTYGTRSYVAEVAAAPGNEDPILASEVDGDLDTIYSAWNGGVDTVNIKDTSVTAAKLAADAKLWQTVSTILTPTGTWANLLTLDTAGNLTIINTLYAANGRFGSGGTTYARVSWNADQSYLFQNNPYAPDDATKASWALVLNYASARTSFLYRAPNAGAGAVTEELQIDSGGNLTINGAGATKFSGTTWANPSDRRLKDDITDYPTGLAAICGLQPRTFLYNGKGGSQAGLRGYGYIADEVEPVMSEMLGITKAKLNADDEEEIDIQTLDTSNVTLALVNAVKELAARVTALEAR